MMEKLDLKHKFNGLICYVVELCIEKLVRKVDIFVLFKFAYGLDIEFYSIDLFRFFYHLFII